MDCNLSNIKMTPYLSSKIKIISFFCMSIVLYIHASFGVSDIPKLTLTIQQCISGVCGRFAVPMFYCISGFLYFQNVNSVNDIKLKIFKRFRTLLIPFVIAACIAPLTILLIENMPGASSFMVDSFF